MKRRTLILLTLCILGKATSHAQLGIHLPLQTDEATALCLSGMEVEADSLRVSPLSYVDATGTVLHLPAASNLRLYGGNSLYLDSVTNLYCLAGISDLLSTTAIGGTLYETGGELTSSNGSMLHKRISLSPAITIETGLGFSLQAAEAHTQTLSLAFRPAYRQGKASIGRVWLFEKDIPLRAVSMPLPESLLGGTVRPYLHYSTYRDENFRPAEESLYENGLLSAGPLPMVAALTAFEEPTIYFPKAITPNGDGINDRFEITTAGNYPDCRLVVLDERGRTVFDKSPYRNDFDGNGLKAGTYYYVFYTDKNGRPYRRATLTILR